MKKSLFIALFLFPVILFSQSADFNKITSAGNGIYFMYYDSSNSKSTIVEYNDYIVLIEAPVKDQGGNATVITEHEQAGEKILSSLKNYFKNKPLKYFLHSHWHPHSVSTINPFLKNGVNIVSTESNYNVIKRFIDTVIFPDHKNNFTFVNDSLIISDGTSSIVAYRFTKKDYPNVPTEDYLFFYMPKQNLMHCACMYIKWSGEPVDGKEMITGREEDLYRFINSKNLKPEYLIRLNNEKNDKNDMQSLTGFENIMNNGIRSTDLVEELMKTDQKILDDNSGDFIQSLISKKIPASIINSIVYSFFRNKELAKALSFARIQTLLNPSDPNAWDTYGEAYYLSGNIEMAEYYQKQSKKISPEFESGGMEVWQKDLENYKKVLDSNNK